MFVQRARRLLVANERGIALVVTVLALVLLIILSLGILQNSVASLRTAGNDRTTKAALAIAEAGAEYARETLRVQLKSGTIANLSKGLARAANGGTLVDATQRTRFLGSTGLVNNTTNTPLVLPTSFSSGSFQVFLTNDRGEFNGANQSASVQSPTDTNSRVMITSFGNGPGGALAAVQEQVSLFTAFFPGRTLPGLIVMPGPDVSYSGPKSQPHQLNGIDQSPPNGCYATVAVTTNTAVNSVIAGIKKTQSYQSCYPFTNPPSSLAVPSVENFLFPKGNPDPAPEDPSHGDNPYDNVTPNTPGFQGDVKLTRWRYLEDLARRVSEAPGFHSTSDDGFTYGSTSDPKIVAIDGDLEISGNTTGAGIVLVRGTLTLHGTPSYKGLFLAIGKGSVVIDGGGNGTFMGSILIANTNTPWKGCDPTHDNNCYVGIPSYLDNGGGNAKQYYDSNSLTGFAADIMPLNLLTFQELR
jgi:Tfp pilus assembly protein PilX